MKQIFFFNKIYKVSVKFVQVENFDIMIKLSTFQVLKENIMKCFLTIIRKFYVTCYAEDVSITNTEILLRIEDTRHYLLIFNIRMFNNVNDKNNFKYLVIKC